MPMDHEFFEAVAKRLAELEAERFSRYAGTKPKLALREYLFRHPSIVRSVYWNRADAMVVSECFDWNPLNFPDLYVTVVRTNPSAYVRRMAERPYDQRRSPQAQGENSRTLIARILLLRLEHLLET